MNQKNNSQFILVLCISLFFIACNQNGKKEEETKTTDSTGTAQTETVQPVTQDAAMDAVKVAPDLYKVLADSMGIRILEATYKPGDSSALHSHPDYAIYTTAGGTATFYGKDGTKMENEMKTGTINIRPGELHSVKNTGKTTIKVILVEVSRPMQITSQDAALDATKVAPALYKVRGDTLDIRVLEINYKPGESSAMHSHPDAALYVIQGSTTEFTAKDGTKRTMTLKSGMAIVTPADTHSVKNTGKTTVKAILVEVNRAMQ
jgi:quercetin dioxygenase-like cupin family protein